jgi:hypothetical protein
MKIKQMIDQVIRGDTHKQASCSNMMKLMLNKEFNGNDARKQ